MAQVSFVKGTTVVTPSRNPVYPVKRWTEAATIIAKTEGGQLYAYDKGIRVRHHELEWRRLPTADVEALRNFVEGDIGYSKESFTYTDEVGQTHTVRLEQALFDFQEDSFGLFSGRILLREELP